MKHALTKYSRYFSSGRPVRSYNANRKNGIMTTIMQMAADEFPSGPLSRKNSGTPTSAPPPKQTSWRFVRLNRNLVLTLVRSLGTGMYGIVNAPFVS